MKILAIIPTRRGSKRLPGKNTKLLNNKPLIEYTIEEAQKSKYITDILIATDDLLVVDIAKKYDLNCYKRNKNLCKDNSPIEDTLGIINKKYKYDIYVLLHVTTPLRKAKHIDKCIETFINGKFDTVISVKELAPHVYRPNAGVYVFKDKLWNNNMAMVLMSKEESIDIDTKFDFIVAEELIKNDTN